MIKAKKGVLIALIFPIVGLLFLVGVKKYILSTGEEVVLPISGYDPRDLLSGRYLTYTIDYGVEKICADRSIKVKRRAFICLSQKKFSYRKPMNCPLLIEGDCIQNRFIAGIERYYVPEKEAKRLEDTVRSNEASLVLSITKTGQAQIKDLLINGKSWQK